VVGQAEQADLGLVAGIGHAAHDPLFHDLFLVADDGALAGGFPRLHEAGQHAVRPRPAPWPAPRAGLQHLGPQGGHLQHLLVGDLGQPPGLGFDCAGRWCRPRPRRCRCRSARPSGRRPRPRRWCRSRRGQGGDAAVAGDPLEAGDHRHPRRRPGRRPASRAGSRRCGARPWASSAMIGICQPSQDLAFQPHVAQGHGQQAGGDLLAGGHHGVVLVVGGGQARGGGAAPSVQATSSLVLPDMAEDHHGGPGGRPPLPRPPGGRRAGCAPDRPPRCRRTSSPAETRARDPPFFEGALLAAAQRRGNGRVRTFAASSTTGWRVGRRRG